MNLNKIYLVIILVSLGCEKEENSEPKVIIDNPIEIIKGGSESGEYGDIEFNENTIRVNSAIEKEIINIYDNSLTINKVFYQNEISVGDVIFFENDVIIEQKSSVYAKTAEKNTDMYFSRIITEITELENSYFIKTKNAKVRNVFKSIDMSNTFLPDLSQIKSLKENLKVTVENGKLSFKIVIFDKDGNFDTQFDQIRAKSEIVFNKGDISFYYFLHPLLPNDSFLKMDSFLITENDVSIEWGKEIGIDDYLEDIVKYQREEGSFSFTKKIPYFSIGFNPKTKNAPIKILPELSYIGWLDFDFKGIARIGSKFKTGMSLSLKVDASTLWKLKPQTDFNLVTSTPTYYAEVSSELSADITPLGFSIDTFFPQFKTNNINYIGITSHPFNFYLNTSAKISSDSNEGTCVELTGNSKMKTKLTFDGYIDGIIDNYKTEIDVTLSESVWSSNQLFKPFKKCYNFSDIESIEIIGDLNFGEVKIGQSKNLNFTIKNNGNGVISFSKINMPPSFTHNLNQSVSLNKGDAKTVTITFSPTEERNYSNQIITIKTNVGDKEVVCYGVGKESASPESLISLSNDIDFGSVQINTNSNTQTLTVSNTGNESFNITNISSSNTAFEIFGSSSVVQPNSDIDIQIRFNPTQEQTYDGVITVENTADNANSSNSSIQVTGTGINNNTGQPNIILTNQFEIDDDTSGGSNGNDNGIPEAGEEIELSVQLQNTGNASATNVTAVLSTNDGDINITDTNETYGTITAGSTDWNTDFDFEIDANCPTKTVNFRLDITSDQGSWQQNFSLNVQGSNGGNPQVDVGNNTPRDNCSHTGSSNNYKLDLNTIYYKQNWNINNIIGNGSDGNRGMWYRFRTTNSGSYNIGVSFSGNAGFQLFSSCTSASPIITSNSSSGNAETAQVNLNGNTEYFIRFYDVNDNNPVNFVITIEKN